MASLGLLPPVFGVRTRKLTDAGCAAEPEELFKRNNILESCRQGATITSLSAKNLTTASVVTTDAETTVVFSSFHTRSYCIDTHYNCCCVSELTNHYGMTLHSASACAAESICSHHVRAN